MTTNKTIDGVPRLRELLEQVCTARNTSSGWIASADAIRELRALLDAPIENVIDLDVSTWEQIKQAASESTWMPPEYMRNEWVSDVCQFLREGPAAEPQGDPVAYADPKSFENFKSLAHLGGLYAHEWMWATPAPGLVPLYAEQPAPVAVVKVAGFNIIGDPTVPPGQIRMCNCNQGRLPCTCKPPTPSTCCGSCPGGCTIGAKP
jgi:hypothetical protein